MVGITSGGGYKWERLWYCSLITLIMGVIKGRPGMVGGFILVAKQRADSLVTAAHIKEVVFNVGLNGFCNCRTGWAIKPEAGMLGRASQSKSNHFGDNLSIQGDQRDYPRGISACIVVAVACCDLVFRIAHRVVLS
ncbi:hypothetical protein Syun_028882 [Stephania yunnanensis]|uniref:Uncharacterized protein n=1 Tax=Stephania yunnanensis TaxID=152371 RepID=A0AAP0HFJ7_9MAGN